MAEVDTSKNLRVRLPGPADPTLVGAVTMFSEVDSGAISGTPYILSPETDDDFRLRIAPECILDTESFNYPAQNTGKHYYVPLTMTIAWTVGALVTNSAAITTATTGVLFKSYAFFPILGASTLYCEMEGSFSNQPTSNCTIDAGLFISAVSNPFAPTDGCYFRQSAAGISAVINYNGVETSVVLTFTYVNNKKYQFIIAITEREVEFWIDGNLYTTIETPIGNGQPFAAAALPFAVRQTHVGAAGAAVSFQLSDYTVSVGGPYVGRSLAEMGNAVYGSYMGLSGGTMGSLASYANSANPTAAVPTNTTSTVIANSLGGQGWETDTLAVTTDGILMAFLNPVAHLSVSVQGRRLRINGVTINSYIQTALTGGGYVAQYSLAYGSNSLTLATASDTAALKAPRRIALGVQAVAAGAVISTVLPSVSVTFQNPIYVNPGEYVCVVKKKVGTAPSAGVVAHLFIFDYAWE